MAASAKPTTFSARWLVGPRYDLTFFIGSCVVTWLFLGLYHLLGAAGLSIRGDSILVVYFLYTALFDHPHIFQTFSRTHADPAERRRNRALHTFGLAGFIGVGLYLNAIGWWREVIVFAAIYGSWHIVRQHWGLLNVYKKLNDDRARLDHWIDSAVFYLGMFAFLLHDYGGAGTADTPIWGSLSVRFPSIPEWIGEVTFYAFCVAAAVFVARQAWRLERGLPINLPKLLLMLTALGTHGLVFFFTATPFLVAEALETAYHNVQYQGWTMTYQRRRFGSAKLVKRWLLGALAYGIGVGTIEVLGLLRGGAWSWLFVPFAMVVVYHYYVDGKIWRTREAPELKRAMVPKGT
jgi:hypothetical protein